MRGRALLVLALAAAAAGAAAPAAASGGGVDPWPCAGVDAAATATMAADAWTDSDADAFAHWEAVDAEGRLRLRNVVRLHLLGARFGSGARAGRVDLCVGLTDTTSYSSEPDGLPDVAWITLHTDMLQPVGVVSVDAECWRRQRSVPQCRPRLRALPALAALPLFTHSPLSRALWPALDAAALPGDGGWLWRINQRASGHGLSSAAAWPALAALPALRSLELTGNDWGSEPAPQLPPLPSLAELQLHNNRLTQLHKDILGFSPKLEKLILARNRLSILPKEIANLTNLTLLDVTNPLTPRVPFFVDHIAEIPNLQILGLENQQLIGDILPILLKPTLRFLNLSGCGLREIGNSSDISYGQSGLQILDLSNNQLQIISTIILEKLVKLEHLLLNNNLLHTFGDTTVLPLPSLKFLELSHNSLKRLSPLTSTNLQVLKIRNNIIKELEDNFWFTMPELRTIDIAQNILEVQPTLKKQSLLDYIDLSQNVLQSIDFELFSNHSALQFINVSHNSISNIDRSFFQQMNNLKQADISWNRVMRVELSSENLITLDLSHNLLTSFPKARLTAKSLNRLSLSHNLITDVSLNYTQYPELRILDISWNEVSSITYPPNFKLEETGPSHHTLNENTEMPIIYVEGNPIYEKNNDEMQNVRMWRSTDMCIWVSGTAVMLVIIGSVIVLVSFIICRRLRKGDKLALITSANFESSPTEKTQQKVCQY